MLSVYTVQVDEHRVRLRRNGVQTTVVRGAAVVAHDGASGNVVISPDSGAVISTASQLIAITSGTRDTPAFRSIEIPSGDFAALAPEARVALVRDLVHSDATKSAASAAPSVAVRCLTGDAALEAGVLTAEQAALVRRTQGTAMLKPLKPAAAKRMGQYLRAARVVAGRAFAENTALASVDTQALQTIATLAMNYASAAALPPARAPTPPPAEAREEALVELIGAVEAAAGGVPAKGAEVAGEEEEGGPVATGGRLRNREGKPFVPQAVPTVIVTNSIADPEWEWKYSESGSRHMFEFRSIDPEHWIGIYFGLRAAVVLRARETGHYDEPRFEIDLLPGLRPTPANAKLDAQIADLFRTAAERAAELILDEPGRHVQLVVNMPTTDDQSRQYLEARMQEHFAAPLLARIGDVPGKFAYIIVRALQMPPGFANRHIRLINVLPMLGDAARDAALVYFDE